MIVTSHRKFALSIASAAMLGAFTNPLLAGGSDIWFEPLTESAPVVMPNDIEELMAPWVTPENISQFNLLSLREVEDEVLSPLQSVVRVAGLGNQAAMFDMIAYDDTGSFLFIPHETGVGAGVSRYDIEARSTEVLFRGDGTGNWDADYGAFDPCRFTPNGTLFLAEEWSGQGRVIEVLNPFAASGLVKDGGEIEIRELDSIPNVAHEGISFSKMYSDVIYFIDENHSGSIYKFVMKKAGDYTVGQSFVLKVDAYNGDASANWDDASNQNATRTGLATWIPISDENGNPIPGVTNPFDSVVDGSEGGSGSGHVDGATLDGFGGRPAADDVNGTPYGRPEDTEISVLRNGHEVVYFTATSEEAVYTVEILSDSKAKVGVLVTADSEKNVGFASTTAVLNSPDNLAQDAAGNIYIIEDAPNGSATGGDIWFARDLDNDGVAESLDHFMSIRVDGCEATGMIFNPVDPHEFVISVQHPDSTNLAKVPNGLGDAVWKFDISSPVFDHAVRLKQLRDKWLKRRSHH